MTSCLHTQGWFLDNDSEEMTKNNKGAYVTVNNLT